MNPVSHVDSRVTGDTTYLSVGDILFLAQFGTPEKPISVEEFLEFWGSLEPDEKFEYNSMFWETHYADDSLRVVE